MFKYILYYLAFINLSAFLITFIDKQKAIYGKWRIQEKTLIIISILGGSIGMLLGMSVFRHKTRHIKFTLGIPFILFLQIVSTVSIAIYLNF